MPTDLHDALAEGIMSRIPGKTEHQCATATHIGDEQQYEYGIFLTLCALQRETFSAEMRSIWKWVLHLSGHTPYFFLPAISLQDYFAHVHWEVVTHNNTHGGVHEND
jgi:hypothetical protein